MEKSEVPEQEKLAKQSSGAGNRVIWDCGSSLYDSFELQAFEKQLDSAIASKTLSMPHLSDRRDLPPQPPTKKPASKISRSLHRLIRAVFRPKNSSSVSNHAVTGDGFYGFYDRSGALSTIPEGPEFDGLSPEIRSLVTRTASERFTATTSVGISCS